MRLRLLTKRGDTIVEVLLAIAIVSAVLAGAYVSAQRSLKAGRAAQERSEALELAEGQLERVKLISTDSTLLTKLPIFSATGFFCIPNALTSLPTISNMTATTAYPAECKSGFYSVSLQRITTGTGPNTIHTFVARVVWPNLTGGDLTDVDGAGATLNDHDVVKTYYRVRQ